MSIIHLQHVVCDNDATDVVQVPAAWLDALRVAASATIDSDIAAVIRSAVFRQLVDQVANVSTDDVDCGLCPFEGDVEPTFINRDQSDWDCPMCGYRNIILHGYND